MRICLAGACGRMGRRILELAAAEDIEIGAAIDTAGFAGTELLVGQESGRPQRVAVSDDVAAGLGRSDVLIDFTAPAAAVANVGAAATLGKPAVVGTTGLTEQEKGQLTSYATRIALVWAPNMSVGVNVLFKLTGEVARLLGLDYNVEIVETHHNLKKDSPSGTALRLGEEAAAPLGLHCPADLVHGRAGMVGPRPTRQIGMHAIRGGDVVGEHTVCFLGKGERLELIHRAQSRDTFAHGALRAARFVLTARPGLYDMGHVLGIK